ncbi:hypothetical protein V3C99_007522 [Haemonchus contortus]
MQESFETIQRRPPALNRSLRSMTITGDAGRRF